MKKILFLLCLVAVSCQAPPLKPSPVNPPDTVYIRDTIKCDSVAILKKQLFLANYKLEKVRFYIKVVKKRPANKAFFFGWTIRAVE